MPSVELTEHEWQQVLSLISEAPWRVANPFLLKIGEQLRTQMGAATTLSTNSMDKPARESMS